MPYPLIYALFYLCVLALLAPYWLLLVGAVRRVLIRNGRLRRLQAEGAVLLVSGNMGRWIAFDPNIGLDPLTATNWGPWFARGEVGLFLIGLLLIGLGYFLERRPRPGLRPWPSRPKTIAAMALFSGTALGILAYAWVNYPWFALPWHAPRILFTLGLWPFAVGYLAFGGDRNEPCDYEE